MNLDRTTIRLRPELKESAELLAQAERTTLQDIINQALHKYLQSKSRKKAKMIFRTHNLGTPLDNLTRDDYYDDPKI